MSAEFFRSPTSVVTKEGEDPSKSAQKILFRGVFHKRVPFLKPSNHQKKECLIPNDKRTLPHLPQTRDPNTKTK